MALQWRHDREKALSDRRVEVLAKLEARERKSLQTAVTRKSRNEERRQLRQSEAARDDQAVARTQGEAARTLPEEANAEANKLQTSNSWKERQQKLQEKRGVSKKRGIPGYSLKRDD